MGYGTSNGLEVRERLSLPRAHAVNRCPRCGESNSAKATRCRTCYSPLAAGAASGRTDMLKDPAIELGALWGELEALTHADEGPALSFQCPECGRAVDESTASCQCGAVFEESNPIKYECPSCGRRVEADATRCACGVHFS